MAQPAEELVNVRKLAREVMESLRWRKDGPALLKGADMFWRRVSRSSLRGVYTDLAVMALREVICEHEAEDRERESESILRRMDAVRTKPSAPPAPPDAKIRHTSQSPGFTEPAPVPVPPVPFQAPSPVPEPAVTAPPAARTHTPVVRPESPVVVPEAAPPVESEAPSPPRWASHTARAVHDLWPELGTYVEIAPGLRELAGKCGLAGWNYQVGLKADAKRHATNRLATAEQALKHAQDIRDAVAQYGVFPEDLPEDVKDRLFQRRAS